MFCIIAALFLNLLQSVLDTTDSNTFLFLYYSGQQDGEYVSGISVRTVR